MPSTCCVPKCKSGYRSDSSENIKLFKVPVDETRRELWLRSIPREWDPDIDISSARIYVCEKHFNDNDFQTDRTDRHSTRKKVKGKQLKRKRLKKDVVLSKWPGIPSYLSKEPFVPRPTSTTSSTLRAEAQTERDNIKYGFTTIEELKNKFDRSILPLSIVDI